MLAAKWESSHPGLVRVTTNKAGATVSRVNWKLLDKIHLEALGEAH